MTSQLVSENGLRCCSYNMHGFANGLPMLHSLCSNHDLILLQEHWLHTYEFHLLSDMFTDFNSYSISAMNDKLAAGLFLGRPFGGVAIMWRKNLNVTMKMTESDDGGRYLAILLNINQKMYLIHCVYFPCMTNKVDYVVETTNLIEKLELNLCNYPAVNHILAGDFNFELRQDTTY